MKEPLMNSTRFKMMIAGIILELLIMPLAVLLEAQTGIGLSQELLGELAIALAAVVGVWIYGRTVRPGAE